MYNHNALGPNGRADAMEKVRNVKQSGTFTCFGTNCVNLFSTV